MRASEVCERCGEQGHAWFFDAGYVCDACMNEWRVFQRFFLDNVIPKARP